MKEIGKQFTSSLKFPLIILMIMWVVHAMQMLFGFDFGYLGIYPRELFGLRGVVFAPFIHGDWQHLISNSIPLGTMIFTILFFYRKVAYRAVLMTTLLTGLAVWLFGRSVYHIGASGVVYALVAFVFWSGVFRKNIKSIVLALIIVFLYSGLFWGILPNQEGISWESHLMGGIVGIFVAWWYKQEIERDEQRYVPSWENEPQKEEKFFLDRDVFERTKAERRNELW